MTPQEQRELEVAKDAFKNAQKVAEDARRDVRAFQAQVAILHSLAERIGEAHDLECDQYEPGKTGCSCTLQKDIDKFIYDTSVAGAQYERLQEALKLVTQERDSAQSALSKAIPELKTPVDLKAVRGRADLADTGVHLAASLADVRPLCARVEALELELRRVNEEADRCMAAIDFRAMEVINAVERASRAAPLDWHGALTYIAVLGRERDEAIARSNETRIRLDITQRLLAQTAPEAQSRAVQDHVDKEHSAKELKLVFRRMVKLLQDAGDASMGGMHMNWREQKNQALKDAEYFLK